MIKRICNKIFFYPDGLGEFLSETGLLDVAIKDALKVFEKETWIVMSPNTVLDNLLEKLEQYVDHISFSLGCDCSDFIDNSQAVGKMKKITQAFIDFRYRARDEQNAIRDSQLRNLRRVADSQVTGLDFGIISNSILAHLVYSEMNDAQKRRQEDEANQYYWRESDNIYRQNFDALSDIVGDFRDNHYIPILKQNFISSYLEIFNKYMSILERTGKINLSGIKKMHYDIHASNSVLNRDSTGSSIQAAIYNALCMCPYNPAVYEFAYNNKCLTRNLYILGLEMGACEHDSMEINDIDEGDMQEINRVIKKGDFPYGLSVPIIDKHLFSDDEFVAMFNAASEDKKETAKERILKHLELENKKAKSLNKNQLSDDVINFLGVVKKLYSSELSTYKDIVEKLYKSEIDNLCKKFDCLLELNKLYELLKTSQDSKAMISKVEKSKQISISHNDIEQLRIFNEIFESERINEIVSLVDNIDIESFERFINELKAHVNIEYERHKELENARQLKEEQLAKEKKEREEKHRREVDEKRRAIKAEIQVLNKEIENLGIALFGKKAKRKAELKEQIARKQKELASIH